MAENPRHERGVGDAVEPSGHAAELALLQAFDAARRERLDATLAALRRLHGERFDPLRFGYIEGLALRARRQRPAVARPLADKAAGALADYLAAYLPARQRAAERIAQTADAPDAAQDMQRLFENGDFAGVWRLAARSARSRAQSCSALATLTRDLGRCAEGPAQETPSLEDEMRRQERALVQSLVEAEAEGGELTVLEPALVSGAELTAMRQVRASMARRQSAQRVNRAIRSGPENPGPLNADALIVRSLAMMRECSPAYANRFVAYMDTLFWLEQAGAAVAPAKAAKSRSGRRR